jgi:hypothetical protein
MLLTTPADLRAEAARLRVTRYELAARRRRLFARSSTRSLRERPGKRSGTAFLAEVATLANNAAPAAVLEKVVAARRAEQEESDDDAA